MTTSDNKQKISKVDHFGEPLHLGDIVYRVHTGHSTYVCKMVVIGETPKTVRLYPAKYLANRGQNEKGEAVKPSQILITGESIHNE